MHLIFWLVLSFGIEGLGRDVFQVQALRVLPQGASAPKVGSHTVVPVAAPPSAL